MNSTDFATLEATENPVEIIVRFVRPVKQEFTLGKKPHPEDEPLDQSDPGYISEEMKRKIAAKVREQLADYYLPEPVKIVCRTHDELCKAIEQAKAAYDLARALLKVGKYHAPFTPKVPGVCF